MMLGAFLAVAVAAGGSADSLAKVQLKDVSLQVPASWKNAQEDGTYKFLAPSEDAYFLVDVGTVQTRGMKASTCVDKIVAAIGGKGWERLKVGAQPAARRTDVDTVEGLEGPVETVTYVGCDGKTTWSVVFHMLQGKKERFAPLAQKIATSVTYARAAER